MPHHTESSSPHREPHHTESGLPTPDEPAAVECGGAGRETDGSMPPPKAAMKGTMLPPPPKKKGTAPVTDSPTGYTRHVRLESKPELPSIQKFIVGVQIPASEETKPFLCETLCFSRTYKPFFDLSFLTLSLSLSSSLSSPSPSFSLSLFLSLFLSLLSLSLFLSLPPHSLLMPVPVPVRPVPVRATLLGRVNAEMGHGEGHGSPPRPGLGW